MRESFVNEIDFHDSTKRKMAINEQARTQEEQAKAEADIAVKMQILANVAHEIRTPMTAILGYADMLAEPHHSPEFHKETAQIIRNNVLFLLQLVNDILDFSKMEAGKLTLNVRPIDLPTLFAEIDALFSLQSKKKQIDFAIQNMTPFPKTINTDPVRVKQILFNLIGNAIKFTDRGNVTLMVFWNAEKNAIRFDVSDTGIGIPSDLIDAIFLPFDQGAASTTHKYGGTGLGLAITKQLTQMLGGELSVQSEAGTGSTFSVVLPISVSPETHLLDNIDVFVQKPQTTTNETQPFKGLRILLAEDDQDICRLFTLILKKAGASVDVVNDGLAAFGVAAQNDFYDIILMDMQMPEMDGYTATRKIRHCDGMTPIIALTANTTQEERQKCLDAGCNDYASKPILRDELIAKILANVKQ